MLILSFLMCYFSSFFSVKEDTLAYLLLVHVFALYLCLLGCNSITSAATNPTSLPTRAKATCRARPCTNPWLYCPTIFPKPSCPRDQSFTGGCA